MSRLVFLGVPAHGHVNPSLALVQELHRRGYEITYYNSEEFREAIEKAGAAYRPYPAPSPSSADIVDLLRGGNLAAVTVLLLEMTAVVLPQLLDDLERERPALIIHDSIAMWGYIAAQLLDLPSVASISHFILEGTALKPSLREMLRLIGLALPVMPAMLQARRRLTQRYGTKIFQPQHLLPVRGDLSLMYTTKSLQPESSWIDGSFRFVGPSINPETRSASDFPFDWLSGAPLVYLSLGTIHHSNTAFFRMACEALADFDGQVVMSIGARAKPEDFMPVPPHILLRNTVPQLELLQRSQVFITHGGMNSIHESLYYGLPMILVPQQMEQLFNARVVVQQGAGLLVGGPFGPPVRSLELREALARIQTEGSFEVRARALGRDLRHSTGYIGAADEIVAAMGNDNP